MAGKREEQLREITERLEQGVKDLFTSEKYTEYLKTMSQFHNYSFNNTLLIAMQKPESTLVAGYSSWSKKFHRQVKRGEKGIKIIAPAPIREKEEIEKFDTETNEPVLRPDGQPETEEVEHIIPRFRVATVFDISQTYGDPLPELDTPELMGSVENFEIFMEAIGIVSPAPMRYAEIEGDAKGYYSNANKEIVIREGMSEKQTMKTAVHEVTHAMCHDRDVMEELGEKKNQMTKEVEAESVAFTVCSYFGLDTSDYSFPYIAGWSSDMDMKELRSSMDFIRKTAGSFIDGMVENIQKLQKEKAAQRELAEDDLVFQAAPLGEDTKKFYLVDNVGRVDFLRLLHTFAEQEKGNGNPEQFLKSHGVHLDLWRDSESLEKNQEMPEFYDVLYMDADHIVDAAAFSTLIQVEMIISRAEYGHTALGKEAHNLAVLYAYKLDNPRDTRELVNKLAEAVENPKMHNLQEIMEDAQEEIDFHGRHILLAEDIDINWEIANEILSSVGLVLDRAENGRICVEMFEASEPGYYEAILMDVRMPEMNGYDATRAIRELDRPDHGLPIIAMTADAFSDDAKQCFESGMDAHLTKPLDIKECMRTLEKFLGE